MAMFHCPVGQYTPLLQGNPAPSTKLRPDQFLINFTRLKLLQNLPNVNFRLTNAVSTFDS